MRITWTIMLTTGPLVGVAEADTVADAVAAVDRGLSEALGGSYTTQHAKAVKEMKGALASGARSWRGPAVWVELEG
jgi:hypothetical protein